MKPWHRVTVRPVVAMLTALVAAIAVVAGLLVVLETGAGAATAPTFEPDPASKGAVSFYNSSGVQITSGSVNDSPMAAYYGASGGALNAGDTLAFVSYATPQDGVATLSWTTNEQWTSGQTWGAGHTYPGALAGSTNAVVAGASTDGPFSGHIAAFPSASVANPNVYQIRLYTSGTNVNTYYSADILVSGSTWTQVYPAVATATSTSVSFGASPSGHQSPGGTVDLTATLAPSAAAGTVQFKDGGTNVGSPVAVSSGTATLSTTSLAAGSHSLTAQFIPTDSSVYAPSTSAALTYLVGVAPDAPSGVSGAEGNAAATVSWTTPASNGGLSVTGYDVQYSSNGGTTWTHASSAFHTSSATTQQVSGLANGTSYVFEVAAINGIGTGAYSTPSAAVVPVADPSKLAQAKSVTVKYGSSTVVSAKLTDTKTGTIVPGVAVQLKARTSTSKPFALVKTVTSNASGIAAATVKPAVNTQYQWVFAGTATHATATSGIESVSVASAVSIHATKTRLVHGTTFKLWGGVAPTATNRYVYLQKKTARGWQTLAKVRVVRQLLPNGRRGIGYVFAIRPSKVGRYVFRVYIPASSANAAGASSSVTITVT